MISESGWIKLHRKIQDSFLWDKPYDKARAWIDLLMLALHTEKKLMIDGSVFVVPRGSFVTSRIKLSNRWGWSLNKLDRFFRVLIEEEMITLEKTRKGTTITIVNYEEYQLMGTTENTTENTTESTTESTQNKNYKNIKNNNSVNDEELRKNFEIIYGHYPKKVGKTSAFDKYKGWVTNGRMIGGKRKKLTNKQIWNAITKYKSEMEEKEQDLMFYKNFDTFMNKAILDYVEED